MQNLARTAMLAIGLGLASTGCALFRSSSSTTPPRSSPASAPPAPAQVKSSPVELRIVSTTNTNGRGPFYVVLRNTDDAGFLSDDYDKVARGLFGESRDPKVLRAEAVIPGQERTLRVDWLADQVKSLGVYFLFTSPGRSWRFVVKDQGVRTIEVTLGENEIQSVSQLPQREAR